MGTAAFPLALIGPHATVVHQVQCSVYHRYRCRLFQMRDPVHYDELVDPTPTPTPTHHPSLSRPHCWSHFVTRRTLTHHQLDQVLLKALAFNWLKVHRFQTRWFQITNLDAPRQLLSVGPWRGGKVEEREGQYKCCGVCEALPYCGMECRKVGARAVQVSSYHPGFMKAPPAPWFSKFDC